MRGKWKLYPRLAWTGIVKNRRIYIPYVLACAGMVMMNYLITFLSDNEAVAQIPEGGTMQMILGMGSVVIGLFSFLFLFYTNSFLMKRRRKEFGMYNILGMGKKNLGIILIWESLIISVAALAGGLLCGVLFSKLGELAMIRMLSGKASLDFAVDISCIVDTLKLYGGIFFLILAHSLWQLCRTDPMMLFRSAQMGEKPPKANWLTGILGAVLLAAAYWLAVSIEEPMSALLWFFVAVDLVIVATYLLFMSGSVVLCRMLQKNRRYYYKTNHFVSVSSMVYRMKRNGAGLASICILSTMVLVMLSSTVCLFIGTEDGLRTRYPRQIVVDMYTSDQEEIAQTEAVIAQAIALNKAQEENELRYRYIDVGAYQEGSQMLFDEPYTGGYTIERAGNIRQLFFVPVEDYNRLMGEEEVLKDDEVLIYTTKMDYPYDAISFQDYGTFRVKRTVPSFVDNGVDAMQIMPSIFVFVPDTQMLEELLALYNENYGTIPSSYHNYYGFDLDCERETKIRIEEEIAAKIAELQNAGTITSQISIEGAESEREGFYAMNAGFFFLGILLGLVFIVGAVLIMYYKQVTEGYEDEKRFEILQKVGMTKKEIRRSINSQVLTVFFLPLLAAGVHIAFAFPFVRMLLEFLSIRNTPLLIGVTVLCYLAFALLYTGAYVITSKAYYRIVSGKEAAV